MNKTGLKCMTRLLLALVLALPLWAGMVLPGNQPDYPPQVPGGLTGMFIGTVPLTELQKEFPQYYYFQGFGEVCTYDPYRPSLHGVCAGTVVPWMPDHTPAFVPLWTPPPYVAPPAVTTLPPVPEPSSWLLVLVSLMLAAMWRWHQERL